MALKAGSSVAKVQRKIRQDALREQIAARCTVQHIFDNIERIDELEDGDSFGLSKLKTQIDAQFRLLSKYLPDLKAMEMKVSEGQFPVFNSGHSQDRVVKDVN